MFAIHNAAAIPVSSTPSLLGLGTFYLAEIVFKTRERKPLV
jgi:hypothetical protein